MSNAVYVSLSQQTALRKQMDAIAQNLANMNTTGFKGERVIFEEFLYRSGDGAPVSYVHEVGLQRNLTNGFLERTGNAFDLAIDGTGYFVVQTQNGEAYTRQGHFQLDAERRIVTSAGDPLLNTDRDPITLEDGETSFNVATDGTVSGKNGALGRVLVVQFDNERNLLKAGGGLFVGDDLARPVDPKETRVVQRTLERSNIEPILEVTRMIDVLRSYQSTQKLMGTDHELRRRAIRDIAAIK